MTYVFLVLFAAVCFGTSGTSQALADAPAGPVAIGAARIVLGGGILGLLALIGARRARGSAPPVIMRARRRGLGTVLLGGLGVVAYQPAFFHGTAVNGVAIGTIIALGSAPIMTGLLEWALLRRPPAQRWWPATALALLGLALLSGLVGGDAASRGISVSGMFSSLTAGLCYSIYSLVIKKLIGSGAPAGQATGYVFGTAALMSLPLLLIADPGWLLTARGISLVLWLGLAATALAYIAYGHGLAGLSASTASTLVLAEPLTAALLGVLVLGETLAPGAFLGLLVLAAGLALLSVRGRVRVSQTAS